MRLWGTGLLVGEDFVAGAVGSGTALVEVDAVGDEGAADGRWESGLGGGEVCGRAQAGQGDVRVVGAFVLCETAAGHGGGDFGLEAEECEVGFDIGEEDAGAGEGSEARDAEVERRRVELVEFVEDGGEGLVGHAAEEDEGEVHVGGWGVAGFRQGEGAGDAGEGFGDGGWDG